MTHPDLPESGGGPPAAEDLGPCPICGRPMPKGTAVDRHHWVPRKHKGREWSWLHRICHKKLHSLYDEQTLAAHLNSPEALLRQEEIRRFVKLVRKQSPEKNARHRPPRHRLG